MFCKHSRLFTDTLLALTSPRFRFVNTVFSMSEEAPVKLPDSTNKWPTPFVNFANASAYPKWEPVDTQKKALQVLRLGVYTTIGAYGWLYIWRRTTFKIGLPLTLTAFATIFVGTKGVVTNLRETNDGWNTFWAMGAANLTVLSAGFKQMPAKHKVMSGVSGALLATAVDHFWWSQSTSFAGRDVKYITANTDEPIEKKQEFWDVWKRRPMSQTVEMLGVGRGIFKD